MVVLASPLDPEVLDRLILPLGGGYYRVMNRTRPITARLIAGALALGGTPFALIFAGGSISAGILEGLTLFLVFAPGWFAYFALIWTASGMRVPGDPFVTWIPCVLVNGFWFALFWPYTDFQSSPDMPGFWIYWLVRIYIVAAIVGGIAGLTIELVQIHAADQRRVVGS